MTDPKQPQAAASREEKLQAIAAVFGDDVANRFHRKDPASPDRSHAGRTEVDPERIAWQQNRLIRHLRARTSRLQDAVPGDGPDGPSADAALTAPPTAAKPVLDRLREAAGASGLAGEHPAVIAHLLKQEPQVVRVSILRSLPGQTARSVMQRLRVT